MKILVIVESPSKIAKIEKILNERKDGNRYIVSASVGHIMKLATENTYGKTLGVDINNDYRPDYVEDPNKYKVISGLRKLARVCDQVWIASDLDFEGEFIGYSLCECLNIPKASTPRLIFNEISKKAINQAADQPTHLDFNLIDARSCRRVMDRLIGFKISSVARLINPKLRVGRVQTMMIKLVNDREKEIKAFQKSFSYQTNATFYSDDHSANIQSKLTKSFKDHEKVKTFLVTAIQPSPQTKYIVTKKTTRTITSNPSAPLITSTLQSLVSSRLGITPKQVLEVAQSLYQKGMTSYPRTDCPKLPEDKMDACQKYIVTRFGDTYHRRKEYAAKDDSAQEAHACIYPINLEVTDLAEIETGGDDDGEIQRFSNWEKRVYRLIWLYTMSSQMSPSKTERTTILIGFETPSTQTEMFQAQYDRLTFEGYQKLWGKTAVHIDESDNNSDPGAEDHSSANAVLLTLKEGDSVVLQQIESKQKASKGPAPYTEAAMMTKLKKHGIGRPSCAGTILEKIITEGLVFRGNKAGDKATINILNWSQGKTELKEVTQEIKTNAYRRRLFSTELGLAVDDFVTEYFPELFNYDFTKELEESMKQIEKGTAVWYEVVDMLYKSFAPKITDFYQKHRPENSDKAAKWERPDKRLLGQHQGKNVYTYLGRYGAVIQIGEDEDAKNRRFIKLPDCYRLTEVTLDEVQHLLSFPKVLGKIGRKQMVLHNGKNGLYLKLGAEKKGYNLKEEMFEDFDEKKDLMEQIDQLRLPLIQKSIQTTQEGKQVLRKIKDIEILKGQYGPYFRFQNKNVSIPKYQNVDVLTYENCLELYQFKLKGRKGKQQSKGKIQLKPKVTNKANEANNRATNYSNKKAKITLKLKK